MPPPQDIVSLCRELANDERFARLIGYMRAELIELGLDAPKSNLSDLWERSNALRSILVRVAELSQPEDDKPKTAPRGF